MVYSSKIKGSASAINVDAEIARLHDIVKQRDPHQPEFLEAFSEVIESLKPVFVRDPKYIKVMETLMEPDRVIQFKVNWTDEQGIIQTNRGFRVQYNAAIGPYKGGLRLHPTVCLSTLKFLGFEQIFKNALTGLPMGGGKGGSDFDPKGKSDFEVRSFCQSFMTELAKHIGPDVDVPAGDIGVGGREIGFLYGQYRRMRNEWTGVLTGKGPAWGGIPCRPEATGYGAVYFAKHMLKDTGSELKGKKCLVSGSGNAAQYCCEKLLQEGAIILTVSDSNGTVNFKDGMTEANLKDLLELKNEKRGRVHELPGSNYTYHKDMKPWAVATGADLAFPCATQNEIDSEDAAKLVKAGVKAVIEVANMPSTAEAIATFKANKIAYAPGKAANAGGVAVSGMEMSQNSSRRTWTFEETDKALQDVMLHIYTEAKKAAESYGVPGDLQAGANIAGFLKVADSMIAQGLF